MTPDTPRPTLAQLSQRIAALEHALMSIRALAYDRAPADYTVQLAVIAHLADEALGDE